MLCQTCVFASGGICGHIAHSGASGAWYIDTLFFMLGWDRYGYDKKHVVKHYVELVFLHSVGSVGHIVHSCASEV
jgi:hypothetical protein